MATKQHDDVEELLDQAALEHLTDEELGEYHDGVMDEVDRVLAEGHLDRCLPCQERYKTMREVLDTWQQEPVSEEDRALIASLVARIPSPQEVARMVAALAGITLLRLRRRAYRMASEVPDGKTEDGLLRWSTEEEKESGDLVIRFDSDCLGLEGERIAVKVGDLRKEVALERHGDQVGGELRVTPEEQRELPDDVELVIDRPSPAEPSASQR